jgi:hypothetical protein
MPKTRTKVEGLKTAHLLAKAVRQHLEALPQNTHVPPGPAVGSIIKTGRCHIDSSCLIKSTGYLKVGVVAKMAKVLEDALNQWRTQ